MPTINSPLSNDSTPPPPEGYATWIDYAIATLQTRDAYLDQYGVSPVLFDRDSMHRAALAELDSLRASAGIPDTFPAHVREGISSDLSG